MMSESEKIEMVRVDSLNFDRANPRLIELDISQEDTDDQIIKILWEVMNVRELVLSIHASGFLPYEALIVARENGRNIVIEGNRRLAAVRLLLNHDNMATIKDWDIPKLSDNEVVKLHSLPVIFSSRKEAWRFLGFKHVNGPAKWSSYAKARYIAQVHREFSVPLSDIARQIGDEHKTVQRLYRGLVVVEQGEKEKVFDRVDCFRTRFAFSHLYVGLQYNGISDFLSLSDAREESEQPVPKENLPQLGELFLWLYGSKRSKIPPLVESQNPHLRQLDAVIKSREGVAAIRAGKGLEVALDLSRPAKAVFEESLLTVKRELQQAHAFLNTIEVSEDLLRVAGTVAELADNLYEQMENRLTPKAKKKRLVES